MDSSAKCRGIRAPERAKESAVIWTGMRAVFVITRREKNRYLTKLRLQLRLGGEA